MRSRSRFEARTQSSPGTRKSTARCEPLLARHREAIATPLVIEATALRVISPSLATIAFTRSGFVLCSLRELVERSRRRAAARFRASSSSGGKVSSARWWATLVRSMPSPLGDLGVGVAGVRARAHEPGEVERRQAMTLLVLGDLSVGVMGVRADDDRDGLEPRPLRGTQALGAEEDAVATAIGSAAHDDRLKDAAQSDVLRELGDFFVGELGPRVGRVFIEAVDRHEKREAFGSECVERECASAAHGWGSTSSSTASEIRLPIGSAFASSTRSSCSTFDLFQGMRMNASCRCVLRLGSPLYVGGFARRNVRQDAKGSVAIHSRPSDLHTLFQLSA